MLSVYTPAKVNLFLNIRGRQPNGYHEIMSVMQAIGLWDRLNVTPLSADSPVLSELLPEVIEPGLHFTCNWPELLRNPVDNLVVRAYRLFWAETGLPPLPLHVHLEKGIPLQAGLGGGSSDAAAMLLILNHLALTHLPQGELYRMASLLGSDVPFFIRGGRARIFGRGERIEPLADVSGEWPLVIVKPRHFGVSTADAYRLYAERGQYQVREPDELLEGLASGTKPSGSSPPRWDSALHNDFEEALFPASPALAAMAQKMRAAGIRRPLLSGSGAAMLGFVEADPAVFREVTRPALLQAFPSDRFQVFRTATWSGGMVQVSGIPETGISGEAPETLQTLDNLFIPG